MRKRMILLISALSTLAFATSPVLAGKKTADKASEAQRKKQNTPGALLFNFSSEPQPGGGRPRPNRTKGR